MRAKPESTIISLKSRASNLIILVDSEIKHKILRKKRLKNAGWKPFFKKNALGK